MNDRYNGFVCDVETAEDMSQMEYAYGISKAAYLRRVLEEDQERKKDILPKLNKIKDLQAEIRQMEEERKKLEVLVTEIAAKMKELKELQEEGEAA